MGYISHPRWAIALLLAVAGWGGSACSDAGANDGRTSVVDLTCRSAQPLVAVPYSGTTLGPKQLALTFDDGPGSLTSELSAYLASEDIGAGFFVNGKNVPGNPGVLPKLVADGHIIGNHTQDHFDMTDQAAFPLDASGDAKLVTQLAATDALIAPFVPSGRFMFRAPYAAYDARDYAVLQASAMNKYTGHIHWDIGGTRTSSTGADWACWQNAPQLTTEACGDLYLAEVEKVGRGIVLMHDADYGNNENLSLTDGVGNTVDMVKYVVPILKARGYTFVRVDAVPAIASALPANVGPTSAHISHAPGIPASTPPSTEPPADRCGVAAAAPSPAPPRSPDAH